MAIENFFGNTVPASTFEEGSALSLGTRFTVTATGLSCVGARWYVGASGPGGGGSITAKLYRNSDQAVLATATISSPISSAWNEVSWSAVALTNGVDYTIVWETPNRYPATTSYPSWPVSLGSGKAATLNPAGFFSAGSAYPTTGTASNYFADAIFDGIATISGTLDARWAVLNAVSGTLDARWAVLASVSGTLDARWAVRAIVSGTLDLRWAQLDTVSGTLDARWAVLSTVSGALDIRWAVLARISGTLDLRWIVLARVSGSLTLLWVTNGVVIRLVAMVTAELTEQFTVDLVER